MERIVRILNQSGLQTRQYMDRKTGEQRVINTIVLKLPDEFRTQQFMQIFGVSQSSASKAIARFRKDGVVEVVSYGVYKKTVSELP